MLTPVMIAILSLVAFLLPILRSLRLAYGERVRSDSINTDSPLLTYPHRETHDALQALMEVVDETIRMYDPDLRMERRIK